MVDPAAEQVIVELQDIADMIDGLVERIGDRRAIPPQEVEDMQAELALLKQRLERGARYGTVDGMKRPQSRWESAYFSGPVSKGLAYFGIRANSHPIKADWIGKLTGLEAEFRMPLSNLRADAGLE